MTTSTQTQLRRGTSTQNDALTGATGEVTIDTTNHRARVHDGATAGGWVVPNSADVQKQSFKYVSSGGTANVITATLSPVPAAYVAGLEVVLLMTAANTAACTLNVNGLGAISIKKNLSGTLSDPASGDLANGVVYRFIYDGTYFQAKVDSAPSTNTYALLGSAVASASATLDFTSMISASYYEYFIVLKDITLATNNAVLWLRSSINNGSTWLTSSSYAYQRQELTLDTTAPTYTGGSASAVLLTEAGITSPPARAINGRIRLANPLGATAIPSAFWEGTLLNALSTNQYFSGYGHLGQTAVNALRFMASTGNITSGTIYLYGLKNS